MESISDSYWLKCRIESALDEDKFMNYSISQKINKLKELDKWVKNAIENSMYPLDEVINLKILQEDIENHLITLNQKQQ